MENSMSTQGPADQQAWRPGTLGLNYWRRCDGADLNQSIEWDAVIVNDHPNHLIA